MHTDFRLPVDPLWLLSLEYLSVWLPMFKRVDFDPNYMYSSPDCAVLEPGQDNSHPWAFHFSMGKMSTPLPCYNVVVSINWDQSWDLSFKDHCCYSKQLKYPSVGKGINKLRGIHTVDCCAVKGSELLICVTIWTDLKSLFWVKEVRQTYTLCFHLSKTL